MVGNTPIFLMDGVCVQLLEVALHISIEQDPVLLPLQKIKIK